MAQLQLPAGAPRPQPWASFKAQFTLDENYPGSSLWFMNPPSVCACFVQVIRTKFLNKKWQILFRDYCFMQQKHSEMEWTSWISIPKTIWSKALIMHSAAASINLNFEEKKKCTENTLNHSWNHIKTACKGCKGVTLHPFDEAVKTTVAVCEYRGASTTQLYTHRII